MLPSRRAEYNHVRFKSYPGASHSNRAKDQDDLKDIHLAEDEYSEEMGPNARVWKLYLDRAEAEDSRMLGDWKDTVDVLLVFAGLFSAVVTTFVVQASQTLQKDYQQATAFLVQELIMVQRAAASDQLAVMGVPSSTVNATSTFIADNLSRWVNGLWFTSLALSLSVALLAVLIKQWIQSYTSSSPIAPQDRVMSRQYRYLGLHVWGVPTIINLLPVLLHVSLLIFFAGLAIFLHPLNIALSSVITVIGVVSYFVYFATPWIPLWKPQCPYKSPLTQVAGEASRLLSIGLRIVIERSTYLCEGVALQSESVTRVIQGVGAKLHRIRRFILENPRISARALEEMAIGKSGMQLMIQALESLHGSLIKLDLRVIALEAFAGLDAQIEQVHLKPILRNDVLLKDLEEAFISCFQFEKNQYEAQILPGQERKAERLARAFLRLQMGETGVYDYRCASCWDCLHSGGSVPEAMPLAVLAKSSSFLYREGYSFHTQDVAGQDFIDICQGYDLKLTCWVWARLGEEVTRMNLRDCFDEGDNVGLLETMKRLIATLQLSDHENDQSRYLILVLHSLGCSRTECPEMHPALLNSRHTGRLLIHALIEVMARYDHEIFPASVQYLYKLLSSDMAWYSGVASSEDFETTSDSGNVSGATLDHHHVAHRTQICLDLVLRELQGVLLNHLAALFDEKLQKDVFPDGLVMGDSEEGFVLEFCFELHHRIGKQSWNEDLMMEVMYCLAIGGDPTNSMFHFLKECFESAESSRAVEVFRNFNGVDALWNHARSKGRDSERRKVARSILLSYYVAGARAHPDIAHSVFELEFDRIKNTDIFIIFFEKIFAELLKAWDQHLEMPNLVANFKRLLDYYEKFGNHDVWQKILRAIASQDQEAPPFCEGGGDPLISIFGAIEALKTKVHAQEARFDLYFRPVCGDEPTGIMAALHPHLLFDRLRDGLDRTEGPPAPAEALKFDPANFDSTIESPRRNGRNLSLSLSLSPRASRDAPRVSMESVSGSPLQLAERTIALTAYRRWRGFVGRRAARPPSESV